MRATDSGIYLSKAEIVALLAFAMDDPERERLSAVAFTVSRGELRAHATNGHVACEAMGDAESAPPGKWVLKRDFLDAVKKVLTNKDEAMVDCYDVDVDFGDVREALVLRRDSDDEDWYEAARIRWATDARVNQLDLEFPDVGAVIRWHKGEQAVPCVTMRPEYLALMQLIGKAAGTSRVDVWFPRARIDAVGFELEGNFTKWSAVVMPMREGTTEEAHDTPEVKGSEMLPGIEASRESGGKAPAVETVTISSGDKVVELKGRKNRS